MKKTVIMGGDPKVLAHDMKKLFGFKVTKVTPCEISLKSGDLQEANAITYKTSKKNYRKYLETRDHYGF